MVFLDERKGVLHAQEHQRLLEEAQVETLGYEARSERGLLSFLREETLFEHLIKLFLLCKNLVFSEEPEEFTL